MRYAHPMSNAPQATTPRTILDDIVDFMSDYVVFTDPHQADVLALWVLHTWAFDAAYATPYIYITSAEKQSGKTRVIEVVQALCRDSVVAAQVSGSSLFRIIEAQRPTLFIDEVDAIFTGAANEDLRGMLNSGYKKNGSVLRTVPGKDGGEVKSFATFAPKLLAGIDNGAMPDTIADRCIRIVLKRKKAGQEVQRWMWRKVEGRVEALRADIEAWAEKNMEALLDIEPKEIEDISDRAFEIAEPLLAIAQRNRGWTDRSREALVALLKGEADVLSPGMKALLAAKEAMETTKLDKVFSADLAAALDMTPKALGIILARYDIRPSTIRHGAQKAKGYYRRDFTDAWERYL